MQKFLINYTQLSPLDWATLIGILISTTVVALGVGSYLYLRDRAKLKRRRSAQQAHLKRLQRLTAKLLTACDRLIEGSTAEETILYQRFRAHGGEYYDDLHVKIVETIKRAQSVLNVAFDLHQKLIRPEIQKQRSLEQSLWDWEMLYATLIGQGENIRNLTADELHTLLNPLLDPALTTDDIYLTEPLNDLRRELAGKPVAVKWQMINPVQIERQGILGYIDQIKWQTANLVERHRQQAPHWLAKVRSRRQTVEAEIPAFLSDIHHYILVQKSDSPGLDSSQTESYRRLTGNQLFTKIDQDMTQIEAALTRAQYYEAVGQARTCWRDLETVSRFLNVMNEHGRRWAIIDLIKIQRYRPPALAEDLQEIKTDVQAITRHLAAGDYASAVPWIEELNADSRRALSSAESWQSLHHQNIANLAHLSDRLSHTENWWQTEIEPAWQQLKTYPQPNWIDSAEDIEGAQQTFRQLHNDHIPQIRSLNSLEMQQFNQAEQLLTYAGADLGRVMRRFQQLLDQLSEVKAAEAQITRSLQLTEADLNRAETLRDKENIKIDSKVDHSISKARDHLLKAKRLATSRHFIAAVNEQLAARRLAAAAYVASDEQVREINALQVKLDTILKNTQEKIKRYWAEAGKSPAIAHMDSTVRLSQQLQDKLTDAEHARLRTAALEDQDLGKALAEAIDAYHEVSRLAEWVTGQLIANRTDYEDLDRQTSAAIIDARNALLQAKQIIDQSGGSGAGRQALQRARSILSTAEKAEAMNKEALMRKRQQAETALRYASLAEKYALWKTRQEQATSIISSDQYEIDEAKVHS